MAARPDGTCPNDDGACSVSNGTCFPPPADQCSVNIAGNNVSVTNNSGGTITCGNPAVVGNCNWNPTGNWLDATGLGIVGVSTICQNGNCQGQLVPTANGYCSITFACLTNTVVSCSGSITTASPPPQVIPSYFQVKGAGVVSRGFFKDILPLTTPISSVSEKSTTTFDSGVIVSRFSTLNSSASYGSGRLSAQGSADPGWRLALYSTPAISQTYDNLLQVVLKNAGYASNPCTGTVGDISLSPNGRFHLYCFGSNFGQYPLKTEVGLANKNPLEVMADGVTPVVQLVLPHTLFGVNQNETLGTNIITKQPIIFFVDGTLTISGNITVPQNNLTSGLVGIVKNDITVTNVSNPTILDGAYSFGSGNGGTFSTGVSANPLKGFGLWMAMGTAGFNLGRTTSGAAGETVTYDPRYLTLFKNVLSRAKYTWKELPPN